MKKMNLIWLVWLTLALLSAYLFGVDGAILTNYSIMAILWFGRKPISKWCFKTT